MSYINEALKKAQKDRDSRSIIYGGVLDGTGRKKRLFFSRPFYGSLLLLFLILLVFTSYSWLDLPDEKDRKIVATSEPKKPKQIKKNNSTSRKSALYKEARNLDKSGRFREAKKLYEQVIEMDPGFVDALNNLGVIYIRDKDYPAAKRSLEKAALLNPMCVESYYNLACLYAIEGEEKLGLAYLKKAASLNHAVREWARNDTDLDNLRLLPEFQDITAG